jgi:hypothetical protein
MTGFVLALAGLACADGGIGTEVTHAPVTYRVTFDGHFKGLLRSGTGPACRVELVRGQLHVWGPRRMSSYSPCTLTADGEGRFRLSWGRSSCRGTYRDEGGRLVLSLLPPPVDDRTGPKWLFLLETLGSLPPGQSPVRMPGAPGRQGPVRWPDVPGRRRAAPLPPRPPAPRGTN